MLHQLLIRPEFNLLNNKLDEFFTGGALLSTIRKMQSAEIMQELLV